MRGGGSGLHFTIYHSICLQVYFIFAAKQASFFLLKGITFLYDISKSFNKPLKKKKTSQNVFFFF